MAREPSQRLRRVLPLSSKQLKLFTERMSWRFIKSPSCWRRTAILRRPACPFQRSQWRGGCTPGMPASCLRQGRKGLRKASGADVRVRLDQARPSARRSKARRDSPGTGPRACVSVLHKRERQLAAPRRESSSPVTDPPPKNGGGFCFFAEFSNGFLTFLVFFFEIC